MKLALLVALLLLQVDLDIILAVLDIILADDLSLCPRVPHRTTEITTHVGVHIVLFISTVTEQPQWFVVLPFHAGFPFQSEHCKT